MYVIMKVRIAAPTAAPTAAPAITPVFDVGGVLAATLADVLAATLLVVLISTLAVMMAGDPAVELLGSGSTPFEPPTGVVVEDDSVLVGAPSTLPILVDAEESTWGAIMPKPTQVVARQCMRERRQRIYRR